MASTYKTLITTVGSAKIAAAISSGSTVNISTMALGDGAGNPTTPDVSQSSLVREVYRANLNSLTVDPDNPNYMVAELVVPSTTGGWTVREAGLFDNAGNLIAVANFPQTYKPVLAEGSARDLVIRMIIEVSSTSSLTLEIDSSVVLATRQWVSDNFSLVSAMPGGTTGQILSKKSNSDADFAWVSPSDGLNILVNVITEKQVLAADQKAVTLSICTTTGVAVYVAGLRLTTDEYTIVDTTHITLLKSYADGTSIVFAQNEPANKGDYLAVESYFSEIKEQGATAQATARANLGLNDTSSTMLSVLDLLYPVGEILITHRTGAPNTWAGAWQNFGTWEAYAAGKVLVGMDSSDSSFNALDETGGSKTVTLTSSQMPGHSHSVSGQSGTTSSIGDHSHDYLDRTYPSESTQAQGKGDYVLMGHNGYRPIPGGIPTSTLAAGKHSHSFSISSTTTGGAGGNQAHSNLQPYQVVFMWKRTA